MSDDFKAVLGHHNTTTEMGRRSAAVVAALAIIQAKVANTPASSSIVADEMENLSKYADQIQAALKVK